MADETPPPADTAPAGGESGTGGAAGDTIAAIEQAIRDASAADARLRLITRGVSLLLLVTILGFLWAIVSHAVDAWSPEKFEPHLATAGERLAPQFQGGAERIVKTAGNEYARLGQEKLQEALPAVRASLATEWRGLSSGLIDRAGPEVEALLGRVEQRQWHRIITHFPNLDRPGAKEAFVGKWSTMIVEDHLAFVDEVERRFGADVVDMRGTLDGFRPNRFEDYDRDRLTRHFVHLWLVLLDRHVLELNEEESAAVEDTAAEGGAR